VIRGLAVQVWDSPASGDLPETPVQILDVKVGTIE
jgi:hypothetical protein